MIRNETKTVNYNLVKEMHASVELIRNYHVKQAEDLSARLTGKEQWMITGEGSSRIFPGKNLLHHRIMADKGPQVSVQSSTLLQHYELRDYAVMGASNSGKTRELLQLFQSLHKKGHHNLIGISGMRPSPFEAYTHSMIYLDFMKEQAVAATLSVMAQALFYDTLLSCVLDKPIHYHELANQVKKALQLEFPEELMHTLYAANNLYWVGHDTGYTEELALKSVETIRKPSFFLPGTFLLHGIEEVVTKDDVIIIYDDFPEEMEKITDIYANKIGAKVIVAGSNYPGCMTMPLPKTDNPLYKGYVKLAAGWNLLAATGILYDINIDQPERARKIGNAI